MLTDHISRLSRSLGRKVNVGTQNFRAPGYISSNLAVQQSHEPYLTTVIARLLDERPGTFIDVGVNNGQTLFKVLAADPSREYIGFEPQVTCCAFLVRFLRDNGLSNYKIVPAALGESAGVLKLQSNALDDEMASSIYPGSIVNLVPCLSGDAALSEIGVEQIAAIKIDVEGAEAAVLRGLRNTLAKHRPPVLFEVLPNYFGQQRTWFEPEQRSRNEASAAELHSFFSSLGYSLQQITESGECIPIEAFNLNDRENYVGRDYLAVAL